ncbi:hypothetical protein AAF712_002845 [Marasmius tenuissimus]|uniref:Uncharacterized protein n=1 Tax=Marasmius tenuissimus TaxID=585030 RepID=A0ABR3A8U2_9AGAR
MPSHTYLPIPSRPPFDLVPNAEFNTNVQDPLQSWSDVSALPKQSRNSTQLWLDEWMEKFCKSSASVKGIYSWICSSCHISVEDLADFQVTYLVLCFLMILSAKIDSQADDLINNLQISIARGHSVMKPVAGLSSAAIALSSTLSATGKRKQKQKQSPKPEEREDGEVSEPDVVEPKTKELLEEGEIEEDDNVFTCEWQKDMDDLVAVLQEMKAITEREYQDPQYWTTFLKSEFARIVARISSPYFLAYYLHPHNLKLQLLYGFTNVLGEYFEKWVFPDDEPLEGEALRKAEEESLKQVLRPSGTTTLRPMRTTNDFLQALCAYPSLIPNGSDPMGVFFLYSDDIFIDEWYRWLGPHLGALGYNVQETQPMSIWQPLWNHIKDLKKTPRGFAEYPDLLRFIIDESSELWDARAALKGKTHTQKTHTDDPEGGSVTGHDKFLRAPIRTYLSPDKDHGRGNKAPWIIAGSCKKCLHEADLGKKCFQYIYINTSGNPQRIKMLRGHGVFKVPPKERMEPIKTKPQESKGNSRKSKPKLKKIRSFDKLNFKWIEPDDSTLEQCGRITFFFMDEVNPDKKIDFLVYNAFPDEEYQQMVQNSHYAHLVKPVWRGSQFAHWTTGLMYPQGKCVPSGGRKADTYTYYSGIKSDTFDAIQAMFRVAYMSIAKLYHPELVKDLTAAGESCGMKGIGGINVFSCVNYTAPLHSDQDVVPSLSCQLEKYGVEEKWGEYGFCQAEYGYAFATRENTLWSFDSSKLHGTMLPSQATIDNTKKKVPHIREEPGNNARCTNVIPVAISSGDHDTVWKKDAARAKELRSVRANWKRREQIVEFAHQSTIKK